MIRNEEQFQKKNVKAGIVISFISLVVSVVIHVLYTPYLLNSLGDRQYGIYSWVSSITSWLSIISLALSSSFVRFAELERKKQGEIGVSKINTLFFAVFGGIGVLAFLAGTILFLLFYSGTIPLNDYSAEEKQMIYILTAISVVQISLSIPVSVGTLYANFRQRFIWLRGMGLLSSLLVPALTILFLQRGGNVIVVGTISSTISLLFVIFDLLYCVLFLHMRVAKTQSQEARSLIKQILVFSSFILISQIVDQINSNADKTILGFLAPEAVTMYQLGMQFYIYEQQMSMAISSSFIPKLTHLAINGTIEDVNREFLKICRFQMLIVFLLVGGFAACGQEFVTYFFGSSHIEAYYIALTLFVIGLVPHTEDAGIIIQRAYNKHKFRAIVYSAVAVVNVLMSISLVALLPRSMAIFGCLIGTVFSMVVGRWIIINIYNKKVIHLDVGSYFLDFAKMTMLTGIPLLLTFGIGYIQGFSGLRLIWQFIIKGSVFTLTYILVMIFGEKEILGLLIPSKLKTWIDSKHSSHNDASGQTPKEK